MIATVCQKMTLKPNYLIGFLKTLGWFSGLIVLITGVVPHFRGQAVDWSEIASIALFCGAFLGGGVCIMFAPGEISWDDKKISLRGKSRTPRDYTWGQLEAYSHWSFRYGTFLLKFEGMQSYQIVPVCFPAGDWRGFQSFLRTRFPEKRTKVWFGPFPMRFGRE
jgi:hypothetical protein